VFRGGIALDLAETITGPGDEVGGDVVDRIGELIDQSLLRLDEGDGDPRASMLETIREFAAEMLAAREEADAIGRRHAETFLDLVERAAPELRGQDQRVWLDRLEHEHDNLRAAMDWAIARPDPHIAVSFAYALWKFWQARGYLVEGRRSMEAMEAMAWTLEPVDRAHFAEAFGSVAYWQSDEPVASYWYDRQLEEWRAIGDRREIANALFNRAYSDMISIMLGIADTTELASGRERLDEALAISRELGDRSGEGNALWGLGSYYYFTADAAGAQPWYERSLELHRAAGDRTMEAWSLHMIALTAMSQRHFDEALDMARHAMRHFYEAGDISGVILTLDDISIISLAAGDTERAGRLWGAARSLQAATGTDLADSVDQTQRLYGTPTARDVLPADEIARLSAEGAAMSLDELVAYALGMQDGIPPASHEEAPA